MGRRRALALVALAALCLAHAAAQDLPPACGGLCRPNRAGLFVARADVLRSSVVADGNDLLALVDRTPMGALAPDYAPSDLVDLATMRPARGWQCTPPARQCLRDEAARAYQRLGAAMREARLSPYVSSAFRSYRVQCSTFLGWTERERGGFCAAAAASALPGHSQHQLGTSIDLFTYDWLAEGDRFRAGFGCTAGGRWMAAHAVEHGFVLPYPLHPDYRREGSDCAAQRGMEERIDPRSGYRHEPWHLRYVGRESASAFDEQRRRSAASGLELTFDQWLRARRGSTDPVGPPVCDGCNCGACATLAGEEDAPCAGASFRLGPDGTPIAPSAEPRLLAATLGREGDRVLLEAEVEVSPGTMTQPPIVTPASSAYFRRGQAEAQLEDRSARPFATLPGAWRLGIAPSEHGWPWQAALVEPQRDGTANGLNARIVAWPGRARMRISMEGVSAGTLLRVALVSDQGARDERRLQAP